MWCWPRGDRRPQLLGLRHRDGAADAGLGIPGSGTAAILLGGPDGVGLYPGPLLLVEHKNFVWGLIASMYLRNVVGIALVLTTVPTGVRTIGHAFDELCVVVIETILPRGRRLPRATPASVPRG
jgi:Tripartite tricarboxylate transporter TctA family